MRTEQLYQKYIKMIPPAEQLELISLISRELAGQTEHKSSRTLLELEGLGAEIWEGTDAQKYVDDLRNEWDNRL
jgi:hypothetical protein